MILTRRIYGYLDMFTLSFRISPLYSLAWLAHNIISALLPTLSVFVTANFISTAIAIYNEEMTFSSIYYSIGLLLAIMLYNHFSGIVLDLLNVRRRIHYRNVLLPEMMEHRATLKYRYIENPRTQDLLARIYGPFGGWWPNSPFDIMAWDMFSCVLGVINLLIFVTGIIITLSTTIWWLGIAMLVAGIPVLIISSKGGQKAYHTSRDILKYERLAGSLSTHMQEREGFEERYIYGFTKKLNQRFIKRWNLNIKHKFKAIIPWHIGSIASGIVTTLYSVCTLVILLPVVVRNDISIGLFLALVGAVLGLSNRLSLGVGPLVGDIARKREYLRDLTNFMALERQEGATELPVRDMDFKTIEFRSVHFRYPDTDKPILRGCTFRIEAGRHYAFVGANGAGKTTIAKLLTGLYDNYEGEIIVDGKNLKDFTQAELKGLSSVIYQDFARYQISLYQNLAFADPYNPDNQLNIEEALAKVGLSGVVAKLKGGIYTPLGKVLDGGEDFSGGEWQRVAMARSILSRAPLKILDEPTAALDPISESKVYQHFEQIAQGKTTLFISHRLGSTKMADNIFVLAEGKITESGTHAQLMAQKGLYAKMYHTQAKWYQDSPEASEKEVYSYT